MKISFKKNNFFSIAFLIFALIFAVSQQAFAQKFPDKPSSKFVSDFAKIYSAEENNLLEEKLVEYSDKTSTQIAVVAITSLGGYPIDDYAIKLANKWGVGQKEKNNGLMILIAAKEHKVFIASGYGMEGALNDGKLGSIIRAQMIPQFKNGNYYAGTNDGVDAIIAAAAGEYVNDEQDNSRKKLSGRDLLIVLFLLSILILILSFSRSREIFFYIILMMLSSGRGSSGGSSGPGFGGGSFGGGGAGGSW